MYFSPVMPRHVSTRYTTAYPRATAAVCPLFDLFMKRLKKDDSEVTSVAVMYEEYVAACAAHDIGPATLKKFGRSMMMNGFTKTHRNGLRHYKCIMNRP